MAAPEARFEGGKETKLKCSDITWVFSRLTQIIVSHEC